MAFPVHRPRRLRSTAAIRQLVRETQLAPSQFILPLFACPGEGIRKPILSMPDQAQMSVDKLVRECEECASLGLGGVILFGIPPAKDELASGAYADDGITQVAVRAIKSAVPNLLVMTDVCNCEYTSHGHCGFVKDNDVDNDITLEWLAKTAVSHARAGADIVAPSDMMDGRVGAIRGALDGAGFINDTHTVLCRKVCVGVLWSVSGGSGIGSSVRGPAQLPDGSGKCSGSHERD